MDKKKISEKYNLIYTNIKNAFGSKPYFLVKNFVKYKRTGKVIDAGCGDGRNSIFLAKKGYIVSAIDLSEIAINKIKNKSKLLNLDLNLEINDVRDILLKKQFDIVISTFISQYFDKKSFLKFIVKMQNCTEIKGIHVISFMNDQSNFKSAINNNWYLPSTVDIVSLYKNWQILEISETKSDVYSKNNTLIKNSYVVATNLILKKI